jgi:hypothetical protein
MTRWGWRKKSGLGYSDTGHWEGVLGSVRRQPPEELIWEDSPSWRILNNADSEDTKIVCNKLIGPLPPLTITEDYTPATL